jgi:glycosyltransferase involved in cell wall biosynthesis
MSIRELENIRVPYPRYDLFFLSYFYHSMSDAIQLSVVIITFNEERNIGRCLDAVREIADDVVVVDSFSSDKTEMICREKGARFVQHKFEGHIEQKNWAMTQAKFPFVLSLDADEAPDDELKKEILKVKSSRSPGRQFDGYEMNRLTNYCGKWIRHCGWYPDTKLRLWDSRKGKWGGINPHDKYELTDVSAKTFHLAGNILHYSYYTVEEHYKQAEKFSSIAANALFQKGKSATVFWAVIKTISKFMRNYFLKAGFLDGKYGFIICKITAWETFQKYSKLTKLSKQRKA